MNTVVGVGYCLRTRERGSLSYLGGSEGARRSMTAFSVAWGDLNHSSSCRRSNRTFFSVLEKSVSPVHCPGHCHWADKLFCMLRATRQTEKRTETLALRASQNCVYEELTPGPRWSDDRLAWCCQCRKPWRFHRSFSGAMYKLASRSNSVVWRFFSQFQQVCG